MKTLPIKDLFHTSYGNKFDLNKMELTDYSDKDCVHFVGRTAKNLGVSALVKKIGDIEPYEAGCITVALGGSILSTFIQSKPFYTSQNIMVLIPKNEMTFNEKLFYCICIEKNKKKYSAFGREANRTLKELEVPAVVPVEFKNLNVNNVVVPSSNPLIKKSIDLDVSQWEFFKLSDLFDIERGRGPRLNELDENGHIPFVTSIDSNNGWSGFSTFWVHNGNVITANRNGSVGEAFYQPIPFASTEDVHVFNPKFKLNIYIALFLVTILKKEKYRYNYGRKWGLQRMNDTCIKLPSTKEGNPDFIFMENYIKSLPYSSSLTAEFTKVQQITPKKSINKKNTDLSDQELIEKYEAGEIDMEEATKKMLKPSPTASNKTEKQKAKR